MLIFYYCDYYYTIVIVFIVDIIIHFVALFRFRNLGEHLQVSA